MSDRKPSKNVAMLTVVAKGLKGLREKVVFVGGATIDLFVTDVAGPRTRATDDVDCVVEMEGRIQYHQLEDELRGLGFKNDTREGAPVCRWIYCGIKVDVMPSEGGVLGFENRWYPDGMAHAQEVVLPDGERVATFSVPYLLASKVEAFHDRGRGDFYASPDMEDIIALLDGCPEAEERVATAPEAVRGYLAAEFRKLLADGQFAPSMEGHIPGAAGPGRVERCLAIMRRIAV